MRRVPQTIRRPLKHDIAHAPSLGSQAVRMCRVWQIIHQKTPSQDAHELPYGRQTILVRQVWSELQPEQQHEDASEKMQRHRRHTSIDNTAEFGNGLQPERFDRADESRGGR